MKHRENEEDKKEKKYCKVFYYTFHYFFFKSVGLMWVLMHRHGPLTFFGPAKEGQGHPAPLSVSTLWVVESCPKPCTK